VALRNLLLAVALAMTALLAVVVWRYPSPGDFLSDNPSWNGMSDFIEEFHARPIKSLRDLPPAPADTMLIVVPYERFAQDELASLDSFLRRGGTLLLMDDYGYGNEVLSYLGAPVRFSGQPLLDPLYTYRNEQFPRVQNVDASVQDLADLALNHATALADVPAEATLVTSSSFSFLDLDGNGNWDPDDSRGPFPVAARQRVGDGSLVVVADPSIVINSMNVGGNYAFIKVMQGERQVLVDESHLPRDQSVDLGHAMLKAVRRGLATPIGGVGLVFAVLLPALWPILRYQGGKR